MIAQDITVNAIVLREIGSNNAPYTLRSMQYTMVVQEIGNNCFKCSQHIRVGAVNHGRLQTASLEKGGYI